MPIRMEASSNKVLLVPDSTCTTMYRICVLGASARERIFLSTKPITPLTRIKLRVEAKIASIQLASDMPRNCESVKNLMMSCSIRPPAPLLRDA